MKEIAVARALGAIKAYGIRFCVTKAAIVLRAALAPPAYWRWVGRYDTLDGAACRRIIADIAKLPSRPVISLIMPECNDWEQLRITLSSMQKQLYPHWQLFLGVCDSAKQKMPSELDAIIRQNGRTCLITLDGAAIWGAKANRLLEAANGEFIGPLDAGDALPAHALYWIVREANAYPEADLIFSDEDVVRSDGTRFNPWFKPDWNPALMTSCNALGRLSVFRRKLAVRLGGFRTNGFDGAEEHELALRCAGAIPLDRIRHIPRILYHRRAADVGFAANVPPDGGEAGRHAVEEHLTAQGLAATVHRGAGGYQVSYALPEPAPKVSVIIATTARPDVAEPCFTSLLERTIYRDFEVLVMVNKSALSIPKRAALLHHFGTNSRIRICAYPDRPFNYSRVNNRAAAQACGEVFCFLNDDTEVISPHWLDQLVARLSLPRVAAVGPMLYYLDETIQHAGVVLGLGGVAGHACVHEPRGSRGYFGRACLEQDVSCVTAACMVVRAEAFRSVGGFDEAMPLAYNDVDFCLRLRAAGNRIVWTPTVELIHRESASLGRHDLRDNAVQFARDVALMQQRWGARLKADPFYNPNLSLEKAYTLAFPPRGTSLYAMDI